MCKSNKQEIISIKNSSSKVLAAQVVSYRILGINKELAKKCMEELSIRRQNGDDFEYEEYIEKKSKVDLPEPINFQNIINVLNRK